MYMYMQFNIMYMQFNTIMYMYMQFNTVMYMYQLLYYDIANANVRSTCTNFSSLIVDCMALPP